MSGRCGRGCLVSTHDGDGERVPFYLPEQSGCRFCPRDHEQGAVVVHLA